jgi:hypothetical protein
MVNFGANKPWAIFFMIFVPTKNGFYCNNLWYFLKLMGIFVLGQSATKNDVLTTLL